ncbi:membrane glycosyltransferase [Tistlia consotensis]|uniref:Glucans biosynthesis glucosyltransferase H n=2 Tax=Tistlia TaxID=1321364 RepID=A0A1Y6CUV2_9PROT|nr:membrane glycosyltransferase [Tistlia consotensis USBA 355]SNS14858.1 membrane glycosyltransferase [Tistlia consotensis]
MPLAARRALMLALTTATIAGLLAAFLTLVGGRDAGPLGLAMAGCFLLTLPWTVIGFWNAALGWWLLRRGERGLAAAAPLVESGWRDRPLETRTALAVPVFNEEPAGVFDKLERLLADFRGRPEAERFELFLLSDSSDPAVVAEEEARFAALQLRHGPDHGHHLALHYRRRDRNDDKKVGNLRDFAERWGGRFDFLLVLDADSLMSAAAVLRLALLMQANPQVGILQSLAVGLPSANAFTRLFQFGMRHGMRAHTLGAAWWQGDGGPYWGHNAILRLEPWRRHCQLPRLAGRAPWGGLILSHDQVEAALMRKAGWEVRVLPIEDGSFEENPPTLLDFIRRDLRWCQGNLQYLGLLARPGFRPLGRLQLLLAILMYVGAPAWMGFMALGLASALGAGGELVAGPLAYGLFATMLLLIFAPKLWGVVDALLSRERRASYGGGARLAAGSALEFLFSLLLSPSVALAQTLFVARLVLLRRGLDWQAQRRAGYRLGWAEAARRLWPQTLAGLGVTALLAATAPSALPWAAPVLAGWLFAVPFAVLTARPALGAWLTRRGLAAVPEELAPAALPALPGEPEPLPPVPVLAPAPEAA